MKVTLTLSEAEVHALRPLAEEAGVTVETVLHHLIAQLGPPVVWEKPDSVDEDYPKDRAEEDAERRREQEEMQANIKRWHAEQASLGAG